VQQLMTSLSGRQTGSLFEEILKKFPHLVIEFLSWLLRLESSSELELLLSSMLLLLSSSIAETKSSSAQESESLSLTYSVIAA
jgi:hypothetical protein